MIPASCYDSGYGFPLCPLWFLLFLLCIPVLTIVWFATLILYAWITVAWEKGIWMRVSLFGLFLRCTSLMWPWPKCIQSILLVISFTLEFLFYKDHAILVHTCHTCALTPYSCLFAIWLLPVHCWEVLTPLDLYVQVPKLGSKWICPL